MNPADGSGGDVPAEVLDKFVSFYNSFEEPLGELEDVAERNMWTAEYEEKADSLKDRATKLVEESKDLLDVPEGFLNDMMGFQQRAVALCDRFAEIKVLGKGKGVEG